MILEIENKKYEFESRYTHLDLDDFLLFIKIEKMKKNVLEKKLFFLKEKISSKHFVLLSEIQVLAILNEIQLFEENFKFYDLPDIFKKVTIDSSDFFYPQSHFLKMRFEEFTKIERIIGNENADISKIMAVIYSNHDNYELGFEDRVKFFQKNSLENEIRKIAIVNYVNDCKSYLIETYLSNVPKSSENHANSWFEQMVNVAKSGVFGDIHLVKKSYLHEILFFMQKNFISNNKI